MTRLRMDDRRALDRRLDRRDLAEEAHGVGDVELSRECLQRRLEWAAPGDLELEIRQLLPRLGKRSQQDDVAFDRDQTPDAEQARHVFGVRHRFAVRIDAVMNDLERLVVEALDVFEVARETTGDGDVHVRQARERAVGQTEIRSLTELVEAVLRREPHGNTGQRARGLSVGVGVDEVCVQDRRAVVQQVAEDAHEGGRVDVRAHRQRVHGHPTGL